uniref:Uncharacterized protein n=1 Tax=Bursaphelenchus xylophilus TaxID=6326 RepID=A0A1I7SEP0_BURXY
MQPKLLFAGAMLIYIMQSTSAISHISQVNLDFELKKAPGDKYYRADIKDDDVVDMYQKWVDTGLSSLMSAIANHKLKRQRRSIILKYGECSSSATDIPKHARCLSKLLKNEIKAEIRKRPHRLQKYRKEIEGFKTDFSQDSEDLHLPKTRGRRSPKVQASDSYTLKTNKEQMTPLGHIAKALMESVKKLKGKSEIPKWQRTVEKLKTNGAKRKKYQEMIENDSEENLPNMRLGLLKEKMGNKVTADDLDMEKIVNDPKELKKLVKSKKIPKTKEDKVISLISPSLFSLHDQGEGIENLTSLPNLLKGFSSQDQQLWLDIIMEAAGVNEQSDKLEQDVNEIEINKTRSLMTNITNLIDENGTPLYATKENATELGMSPEHIEMFEKFHTNYSKEQLREMNTTGYSILKPHQIEMIYGPNSPYADAAVYNRLMNMTEEEIRDHLHDDFQRLAELEHFKIDENEFAKSQTKHHDRRRKRQLFCKPVAGFAAIHPVAGHFHASRFVPINLRRADPDPLDFHTANPVAAYSRNDYFVAVHVQSLDLVTIRSPSGHSVAGSVHPASSVTSSHGTIHFVPSSLHSNYSIAPLFIATNFKSYGGISSNIITICAVSDYCVANGPKRFGVVAIRSFAGHLESTDCVCGCLVAVMAQLKDFLG